MSQLFRWVSHYNHIHPHRALAYRLPAEFAQSAAGCDADLLTTEGRMKPSGELRAMLERAGFQPGEQIVTHCDGGGRAALAALAAVQACFTQVNAYYLSFSDWAKDESCPIVKDGDGQ